MDNEEDLKSKVKAQRREQKINDIKFLNSKSNIPYEYEKYSFKDYEEDNDSSSSIFDEDVKKSRKKAKKNALEYIIKLENIKEAKSIIFIGQKGSGKTVLATLILRYCINKYLYNVLYVRFPTIISELSTSYHKEDVIECLDKYSSPDILCIDEVEDIEDNQYTKRYLQNIIITRHDNNKPTIITSKLKIGKFSKYFGKSGARHIEDPSLYKRVEILSKDLNINFDPSVIESYYVYSAEKIKNQIVELLKKNDNSRGGRDYFIQGDKIIDILKKSKIE